MNCPVVRFPSEGDFSEKDYFYPLDPSLKDFLLSWAFSQQCMASFNYECLLTPSANPKNERVISDLPAIARLIDERACQLGFEPLITTGIIYRFYDHQEAAIYLRFDNPDKSLSIAVSATTRKELNRITGILSADTSLVGH